MPEFYKCDYHLHGEFSADSHVCARELVEKAIRLGYTEIAFTEHLDLLPWEVAEWGIPAIARYKTQISRLQQEFPQLSILWGIEVGDYQLVRNYADCLLDLYRFDLVLGSVHFLSDRTNVSVPLTAPLSLAQRRDYYEQNLDLVSTCEIDVLAHLGVYKRYYPELVDESPFLSIIQEIFARMIARNIALEVNYSSLRKNYPSIIPEPLLLSLYHNLGGKLFTIGSDSHHINQFDDFYAAVPLEIRKLGSFSRPLRHH